MTGTSLRYMKAPKYLLLVYSCAFVVLFALEHPSYSNDDVLTFAYSIFGDRITNYILP